MNMKTTMQLLIEGYMYTYIHIYIYIYIYTHTLIISDDDDNLNVLIQLPAIHHIKYVYMYCEHQYKHNKSLMNGEGIIDDNMGLN